MIKKRVYVKEHKSNYQKYLSLYEAGEFSEALDALSLGSRKGSFKCLHELHILFSTTNILVKDLNKANAVYKIIFDIQSSLAPNHTLQPSYQGRLKKYRMHYAPYDIQIAVRVAGILPLHNELGGQVDTRISTEFLEKRKTNSKKMSVQNRVETLKGLMHSIRQTGQRILLSY